MKPGHGRLGVFDVFTGLGVAGSWQFRVRLQTIFGNVASS